MGRSSIKKLDLQPRDQRFHTIDVHFPWSKQLRIALVLGPKKCLKELKAVLVRFIYIRKLWLCVKRRFWSTFKTFEKTFLVHSINKRRTKIANSWSKSPPNMVPTRPRPSFMELQEKLIDTTSLNHIYLLYGKVCTSLHADLLLLLSFCFVISNIEFKSK